MPRRTSATVTPVQQNPVPPVREVAEDREPASNSSSWSLYLSLALIVLSLGGGGIATFLSLLGAQLPAGTQVGVMVLTSLSAMALSAFIFKGLGEIKSEGVKLLNKIGPAGSDERIKVEDKVGSGRRAYRLAQAGQAAAAIAVVSNGVMLVATTLTRTETDHAEALPLAWSLTNALLTSSSSLAGFLLFTSLGARNGQLLTMVHENKLGAVERRVSRLKGRLREAGLVLDADELAPAAATDLFRRRPSAQVASANAAQQLTDNSVPVAGAGAVPTPAGGHQ